MEQIERLNQIIREGKINLSTLEKEKEKIKSKIGIAWKAIQLLLNNNVVTTEIESWDNKYEQLSMKNAILNILQVNGGYWTGKEIYYELIKHGYISKSSNLQRDVHITLFRLRKDFKINKTNKARNSQYHITEKESV